MDTTLLIVLSNLSSGTDTLDAMAEVARKFGPFFFSVLFLTYMTRWAQKRYSELASRKDPAPTTQEKAIYASVFLGTLVVGIVLVGISVRWWLHFGQDTYICRGVFKNLHSYEQLDSDEGVGMFFHDETKKPNGPLAPNTDLIHNSHFIVVRTRAFVDCERFAVNLSKGSKGEPSSESFEIEYRKEDESEFEPAFTIDWDTKLLKNVVKREHPTSKPCSSSANLVATVYADTLSTPQAGKKQSRASFESRTKRPAVSADIEVLQDSYSSVGSKLRAIEDFAALPQADQNEALSSETGIEPLLVTFLDLTRHSDKELAYRVITALQNFDSDTFVINLSRSDDSARRATALVDIEHMESPQVDRLLQKLKGSVGPEYSVISSATRDPKNFQRLRPTGSSQGDRYYVRATWDPNNQSATNCLTNLFNRELISSRSLQQEYVKMQGRNTRLVYWYTKEWAKQIANQVRQCGGSAEYVSP